MNALEHDRRVSIRAAVKREVLLGEKARVELVILFAASAVVLAALPAALEVVADLARAVLAQPFAARLPGIEEELHQVGRVLLLDPAGEGWLVSQGHVAVGLRRRSVGTRLLVTAAISH